ncbi:MAG: ABC transporter permease [Campylobacteraceae bacterium]|nr:ABC transporter permease [Campylobacteraceae bacterium]
MKTRVDVEKESNLTKISLFGRWDYKTNKNQISKLKNSIIKADKNILLDFKNVEKIDYSVIVIIKDLAVKHDKTIKLEESKFSSMFSLVDDEKIDFKYTPKKPKFNLFYDIGKAVYEAKESSVSFFSFLGELSVKSGYNLFNPRKLRVKEISNHCRDMGINAVFIVSLTAFLIGVVLVYIGSDMLGMFGATIFIVEIMGMITLRELAPLLAAIVVAGRTASSFTAQIGVMKITEEIDAMKTMSFDPFIYLVIPRIIAMIIIMPFVVFLADMASILGQMIVAYGYLDIPFDTYLDRFKDLVKTKHFWAGMIKAPFFGLVIALVGCLRGLQVDGSTESIGEKTTISVVNAIFWVIVIDAIFAIFFIEVGI